MRVTKLKLNNCGLHEQVDLSCDSPIVGVCGINGSGKSTVLEMLRYALTSETNDNIDTYVKHGAGNGSVELTFRKNGLEHTIFRQFGKSPRRTLKSGTNAPLTKVKDIDVFLASLLGADRLAMNSAVFIGQGKLEELLFRGDADRRSLFIKLVNLGFCASRSDAAAHLLGEVGQQVANLEPVLTSAEELLKVRETEMAQVLTTVADIRDWSPELAQIGERQRLGGQRDELARQLHQAEQAKKLRLQQLGERYPAALDHPDYYQQLSDANEVERLRRKDLSDLLQRRTRLAHEFRRHLELSAEQQRLGKEVARLSKELADLPDELQLRESIQQLNQKIDDHSVRKYSVERLDFLKLSIGADTQLQLQIRKSLESVERDLECRKAEQRNATEALRLANERSVFGRELRRCFQVEGRVERATCPKCSLTVVDIDIPTEESLDAMTVETGRLRQNLVQLNAALASLEKQVRNHIEDDARLTQTLKQNQEELAKLEATVQAIAETPEDQGVRLSEELKSATEQQSRRIRLETSLQQNQATWRTVMTEQLSLVEWKSELVDNLRSEQLQALAGQITTLDEWLRKDNARLQDLAAHLSALELMNEQHKKLEDELVEVDYKLSRELLSELEKLVVELNSLAASQVVLEERQSKWNEATRLKVAAEASLQAAQNQVADIRRRMDQDKERRLVMRDLVLIKELFADGGLPATVVGHYFKHLGFITQRHLQSLNANFRIELDPQRPLTFCFERLDKPEGILPMSKLSGGQKVRLCLAFLMAVQEVLVPDVGLMVLDEVSDSLDEEGVESLAELLRGMAGRLQNADHQLWVVDHRKEIANALPVKLELKAP